MADKYAEQTKGLAGVKKEKQDMTWEGIAPHEEQKKVKEEGKV